MSSESIYATSIKEALLISLRRTLEITGMIGEDVDEDKVKNIIARIQSLLPIVSNKILFEDVRINERLKVALEKSLDLYDKISKLISGNTSVEDVEKTLEELEREIEESLETYSRVERTVRILRLKIFITIALALILSFIVMSISIAHIAPHIEHEVISSSLYAIPALIATPIIFTSAIALKSMKHLNIALLIIVPLLIVSEIVGYTLASKLVDYGFKTYESFKFLIMVSAVLTASIIYYAIKWNLSLWTPKVTVKLDFEMPTPKPVSVEERAKIDVEALEKQLRIEYRRIYGPSGDEILKFELRKLMEEGYSRDKAIVRLHSKMFRKETS